MPDTPINRMRPVHPGEVLREEYLKPRGWSVDDLARRIAVPAGYLYLLLEGRAPMLSPIAHQVVALFGGDVGSWLRMQARHDDATVRSPTAEQRLRDALELMGSRRAQNLSAGDLSGLVADVDTPPGPWLDWREFHLDTLPPVGVPVLCAHADQGTYYVAGLDRPGADYLVTIGRGFAHRLVAGHDVTHWAGIPGL